MDKMAKQAQGGGSIRQRKDGRWEARVTVGRNPGTGAPIRRSVYGDTQKIVRQKMTAIQSEVDRGTYQAPSKITVAAWLEEWMATFCANRVKPLTYQSYETIIRRHIVPAIGAVKLQALRGSHVQRIYNAMKNAGLSADRKKRFGRPPQGP